MEKVVITLDEKYKSLVEYIRKINYVEMLSHRLNFKNYDKEISELMYEWFKEDSGINGFKVIERIHSADEIKFVETKYKWRMKNEYNNSDYFVSALPLRWFLDEDIYYASKLTESEFKKRLKEANCPIPFECWEAIEI
ncbi:hypothetical protein RD055328_08530 [Companilactobacillus sp. RD055328]|uniref:hypothetical protein n=1 Tax=Companilactobacillus sp. RD055328 TaxID=2916634 RepID=UPI001FC8DF7D|nr:hypothetical protein [Companilactobacillus sp. RD055328]GKQ42930.1 hypothetical protein RD055328_08530 [Companilactobacillus sp. RD055328]